MIKMSIKRAQSKYKSQIQHSNLLLRFHTTRRWRVPQSYPLQGSHERVSSDLMEGKHYHTNKPTFTDDSSDL